MGWKDLGLVKYSTQQYSMVYLAWFTGQWHSNDWKSVRLSVWCLQNGLACTLRASMGMRMCQDKVGHKKGLWSRFFGFVLFWV